MTLDERKMALKEIREQKGSMDKILKDMSRKFFSDQFAFLQQDECPLESITWAQYTFDIMYEPSEFGLTDIYYSLKPIIRDRVGADKLAEISAFQSDNTHFLKFSSLKEVLLPDELEKVTDLLMSWWKVTGINDDVYLWAFGDGFRVVARADTLDVIPYNKYSEIY